MSQSRLLFCDNLFFINIAFSLCFFLSFWRFFLGFFKCGIACFNQNIIPCNYLFNICVIYTIGIIIRQYLGEKFTQSGSIFG